MGPSHPRDMVWTPSGGRRRQKGEEARDAGAQTFIAGVWEVTLGRGGSSDFSVHPPCALRGHRVPWLLLFFSFLSCGTCCSIEDPVRWPTSPRASSEPACKVEINHGQVPLWGFHRKDTALPAEEDVQAPSVQPANSPSSRSAPGCGDRAAFERTLTKGDW